MEYIDIDLDFSKTRLRPKVRRGPAKGITAYLLLTLAVGGIWLSFIALIDAGIIRELNMLELAVAGLICGGVGSIIAFIINRNLYNQGKKAQQQGGW